MHRNSSYDDTYRPKYLYLHASLILVLLSNHLTPILAGVLDGACSDHKTFRREISYYYGALTIDYEYSRNNQVLE